MLPSPGPTFLLLFSQAAPSPYKPNSTNPYSTNSNAVNSNAVNSNTGNQNINLLPAPPSLPPSNAIEKSLIATMMRSTSTSAALSMQHISQQQPPPLASTASSNSSNVERGSFRDRDLEREQRDRDRDRSYELANAGGSGSSNGGRYHDYDSERYGSHRRDSGYGRNSPDEYSSRGHQKGWKI